METVIILSFARYLTQCTAYEYHKNMTNELSNTQWRELFAYDEYLIFIFILLNILGKLLIFINV